MRRGVFQEYEEGDGARVYRLRWVDEVSLSPEDVARVEFIRYLVCKGRLNEGFGSSRGADRSTQ